MAQRLSQYLVHTDAAFTPDEQCYLIFGQEVPTRSSWIKAAEWSEAEAKLTLTMESGNSYDFHGMSFTDVQEFMESFSLGVWYHSTWLGSYGVEKPFALSEEDRIPNRARRVL